MMKRRTLLSLFGGPAAARLAGRPESPGRSSERFFGLHIDLHPNQGDTALGREVSAEMVERVLAATRPDFVQYDCKGGSGYIGYPTRISVPAPGIVKDSVPIGNSMIS